MSERPEMQPGKSSRQVLGGDRIGVIGLGAMGIGIASSALAAGFEVIGYDVRTAPMQQLVDLGGHNAESVADVAARATLVAIVVVDEQQLAEVMSGIVAVAPPGLVVVVHSTFRPVAVRRIADDLRPRGVSVIDAPVSGGPEKAARGTLSVFIGGEPVIVRRCQSYLDAISSHVFYFGDVGSGQVGKLANNCLSMAAYAVQLEVMELAAAYGIEEDAVVSAVVLSQGDSRGLRTWGRMDRLLASATPSTLPPGKDLRAALAAASDRGIDMPMVSRTAELIDEKLVARARVLSARGPVSAVPLCDVCGQELAVSFREAGTHPECAVVDGAGRARAAHSK